MVSYPHFFVIVKPPIACIACWLDSAIHSTRMLYLYAATPCAHESGRILRKLPGQPAVASGHHASTLTFNAGNFDFVGLRHAKSLMSRDQIDQPWWTRHACFWCYGQSPDVPWYQIHLIPREREGLQSNINRYRKCGSVYLLHKSLFGLRKATILMSVIGRDGKPETQTKRDARKKW